MYTFFKSICQMSQENLKKYVAKQLKETHKDISVGDGYVYAQGEMPILLVAHMDTVHAKLPETIVYDEQTGSLSSPQGIGGDDRCGIYMILEIIKRYNCSVLFCEDEEIGCIGADKFTNTELAKSLEFNYIIELDRMGCNDAVFYDCDNQEFEDFITKDFYKTAFGSFSDISILAPFLGCAAVNLSCGYYKAHTQDEYVVMSEMINNIHHVCEILERTTEDDKFEYIEAKYRSGHGYYYGWGDDWDDVYTWDKQEKYYMIEFIDLAGNTDWYDTTAVSKEEAVGKCLSLNPDLTYNDIISIYDCENY